jgi:murein DD-endopeptidase MepM/ murein hydrolase activator NlpD
VVPIYPGQKSLKNQCLQGKTLCVHFYRGYTQKSRNEKEALIRTRLPDMVRAQFNSGEVLHNSLKDKSKNIKLILLISIGLLIVVPLTWVLISRMESEVPAIAVDLQLPEIGAGKTLNVQIQDKKSGLKRVWIGIFADGKEFVLLEKNFPSAGVLQTGEQKSISMDVAIEPKKLGLKDGAATLRLMAADYSWRDWGKGNRAYLEKEIVIDTKPPAIEVLSKAHNINTGGAGLVLYKLSEPCHKSGVRVGEQFFPGYKGSLKDPDVMMAFFALHYRQGSGTDIFLTAEDRAGNTSREWFPHHIRKQTFKQDTINITERFLEKKMPEFGDETLPDNSSLIDKFLYVNSTLRTKNKEMVEALTGHGDTSMHWKGAFLRLPKSANRAGFADHRAYRYKGRLVDEQDHLGIDLASVAHSPVPAANAGRVVFAGRIGIYGNTLIVDHGFGLFSMYAHLSRMDVETGHMVEKGEIMGRTGMSGLAGGDHLHFSMIIHNTFVNPIEWWDAMWIKNNVTSKLEEFGG